jgi:dihydropyrimidine dehydrogenase (NAD+) subunit PreA
MVEVKPERESITWDELSHRQPEVTSDWEAMKKYREQHGIHIH